MDTLDTYKRLYVYDDWANRETLRGIVSSDPDHPRMLQVMSHLVAAQQLWLDRLHGDETSTPVWPTWTARECDDRLSSLHEQWQLFLDHQRSDKLLRPVAYVNSKQRPWASQVEEILMHVIVHSAHHRGQIAMLIRDLGHDPPLTDFVHAVRTGLVE